MNPISVNISDQIYASCPHLQLAVVQCKVTNSAFDSRLWEEIHAAEKEITDKHKTEDINKIPTIQATRLAYKSLGKDPNRYRPSAEALCRRIVKGMGIYQIDTLVDLINLVSIRTGYSIGGFDADKIQGNSLTLGVGLQGEHFEAIGRGLLNIEGLPVYRDAAGGIGTPTSDEERTKITPDTSHLLMIFNGYSGKDGLPEAVKWAVALLEKYVQATGVHTHLISCGNRVVDLQENRD